MSSAPKTTDNSPTVLIVETDVLIRHLLAEYLRECGFRVVEAVNAEEALICLKEPDIRLDIALIDVESPNVDGFTLMTWLRTNQPEVEIATAGSAEKATRQSAKLCEEGPQLARPYDHQIVLDRIRRLLAARDRNLPGRPSKTR